MRTNLSGKFYPLIFIFTILIGLLVACTNSPIYVDEKTGLEMALVPAGEFQMTILDEMKNEKSVQTVHLNDYYIDVFEVTNQHYAACVQAGECVEPLNTIEFSDAAYLDHQVIYVTWDMANSFCEWRSARLPTRAEWEKAAADELETVDYYWGDVSPLCQVGSRMGAGINHNSDYNSGTKPVGISTPNAYGLYEMTEGMWEWVQDKHELEAYATSPDHVSFLRLYQWSGYGPLYNRYLCTFRCARSP